MKVLNPLFDSVFKYLLEDIEIAKALIEAITKEQILELFPAPQDSTSYEIKKKYNQIGMVRQDYVAVVKTTNEEGKELFQKVMIEVQKSPIAPEISRFRQYIADKYRKKSSVGNEEKHLPIKTIYMLEEVFNPNLPAVLGRKGVYYDELENTVFEGEKDKIVELFNHDSWFIQTEKLPAEFKSDLMYVLSVFAPWYRDNTTDRYINLPDSDILRAKHRVLGLIYRRLEAATQDNEVNTAVEVELDYNKYLEKLHTDVEESKAEAQKALKQAEQERAEKEKAEKQAEQERSEKEKAEKQAKQERAEKEKAEKHAEQERAEKEKAENTIINLVKILHSSGMDLESIAKQTNQSLSKIKTLLDEK